MGDENEQATTATAPAVDLADPVHRQATAIAEAILPQLEPAIQARIDTAIEAMRVETLATLTAGMGQVATRLRPPAPSGLTQAGPFASFGEQLQAVRGAAQRPNATDERLLQIGAVSGMSEGVPADGGFLLQDAFVSEIFRVVHETGLVWSRIPANRKVTLTGNSTTIKMPAVDETSRATGSRWGGVRVYRVEEGASVTASKPEFKRLALELSKSMGIAYLTNEQIQDTPVLEAIVRMAFGEELAFSLDDDAIRGSGTGAPLGLLNSDALVTVAKEAGQAADTIVYENVQKMWARLQARSRANAVWFINQDCEPQLQSMALVIGTGGVPVYLPPGGLAGSPYASLFGRPVIPIEQCSTLGDVGDIILADMTQFWAIDKGSPTYASSMHVQFLTDETAYRVTYRNDFRPLWTSALTPYKGSNTISPYVALAARD